jgi:acyl-coenzyme A synthetase/AMP-(fatty) acid ligase
VVEAIPRNPSGKPLKAALAALASAHREEANG